MKKERISTPHLSANKNDITKVVIMVGDPNRSKYIAKKFLSKSKKRLITNIRGIHCYTGFYKKKKITIMSHGMGNPSMGIYSYELFNFFNVEKIIRVGSIGSLKKELNLNDIILCEKTYTKTNYNNFYQNNGAGFISASKGLLEQINIKAKELKTKILLDNTYNADNFYGEDDQLDIAKQNNLCGVEMEIGALYLNAIQAKKEATAICTVSDNIITNKHLTSKEREVGFDKAIILALETAIIFL